MTPASARCVSPARALLLGRIGTLVVELSYRFTATIGMEAGSRLASTDLPATFRPMSTLQEIEEAALRLPQKDRLHLADRILGSLPAPLAPADSEAILAEAIQRDADLESGKVRPLTEEAFWAGVRRRS
jgi:putative addiction module component (TIGR02574 family)